MNRPSSFIHPPPPFLLDYFEEIKMSRSYRGDIFRGLETGAVYFSVRSLFFIVTILRNSSPPQQGMRNTSWLLCTLPPHPSHCVIGTAFDHGITYADCLWTPPHVL